ncbi:phage tail protein [uncultured Cellulomonas sp.]|uniref:phage tail protein n=1 Tax=uncultured Cellulomonas sp. TaxID=189682 RepID=UPI00262D00DD|nr:phage tail protein [uncultured Cellulomonas sp.]
MTVDASPRNPLRTYTFRLRLDGAATAVAGVRRVSGLSTTVQAHEIWSGGNSLHRHANPDRATWEPITLEQGLALDDSLETWAAACVEYLRTGRPAASGPVKRNVVIEVWDPHVPRGAAGAGTTAGAAGAPGAAGTATGAPSPTGRRRDYEVVNAWISRFQALPALDAMTNEVGLLTVELTHEGWRARPPDPAAA